MTPMEMLREFHEAFSVPSAEEYSELGTFCSLRSALHEEEFVEVDEELYGFNNTKQERIQLAKELADGLYVLYGTADLLGLKLDEVFAEVHRSNMSKLDDNGKPIYRNDGKVLKGSNYTPPELGRFV